MKGDYKHLKFYGQCKLGHDIPKSQQFLNILLKTDKEN